MEQFDFDSFVNRRHTGAVKWNALPDGGDEVIPMWVADMDFTTAPCIIEALRRRVEHGVFGYVDVTDDYYNAVISWYHRRHNWDIKREWIQYTTAVVPAVSAVIKALTTPGDEVALLTPAYNCFFSSIRNNGCTAREVPLKADADGRYDIDRDAFETALADKRVKVLLFCNPHNPVGRIWTRDELVYVSDCCARHDVALISDEIHCELVLDPTKRFIPTASVSDTALHNTVTCSSPSKNFNTAGLQIANIITENADRRALINRAINDNETCDVGPFGVEGLKAAYNEGEPWLDALLRYLRGNFDLIARRFADELPGYTVTPLEATYLAWVDIRPSGLTSDEMTRRLLDEAKVMVNSGLMYGAAGEGFIRINFALPRKRLMTALDRIIREIKTLPKQ